MLVFKRQIAKCATMLALEVEVVYSTQPATNLQQRTKPLVEVQVIVSVEGKKGGQHIERVHEYRKRRWYDKDAHENIKVKGLSLLTARVLFRVKQYVTVQQPGDQHAVEQHDSEDGALSAVFDPKLVDGFKCIDYAIAVQPFLDGYSTVCCEVNFQQHV